MRTFLSWLESWAQVLLGSVALVFLLLWAMLGADYAAGFVLASLLAALEPLPWGLRQEWLAWKATAYPLPGEPGPVPFWRRLRRFPTFSQVQLGTGDALALLVSPTTGHLSSRKGS